MFGDISKSSTFYIFSGEWKKRVQNLDSIIGNDIFVNSVNI